MVLTPSNGHSSKDCYEQQSESAYSDNKKRCGSHSHDQCYHQRNGSRNPLADSKSTNKETFVEDSNVTGCNKRSCNGKIENKYTGNGDEPNNTPAGIGFGLSMYHPPISQEADGFQLLVESRSSKHFIGPELIRGVEMKMLKYTRIEPPTKIRVAGDNVLRGTEQGMLLVLVRGTDDILKTVILPIVLVPGLKSNLFSSSAAAKKGVKAIIEENGSFLDLGSL